ncbi:MAG: VPLPA-CTERM sorting domain-containing protein [Pseudomonadota bacterium]
MLSDIADIAVSDQDFTFTFADPLPSDGTPGTFTLTLDGDFSENNTRVEFATLTFGGIVGNLVVDFEGFVNDIPGLSITSFVRNEKDPQDVRLTLEAGVTATLLSDLLSGGSFEVNLDLAVGVDSTDVADADFVAVALQYESIPLPASLPMLLGALGAAAFVGRRRSS